MTRILIVTADDLGIARSVNLAILDAHRNGIVTSASLMANMPAFEHAVTEILPEAPGLGTGAHLCLTSGRPCSAPADIPLLVDEDGMFRHGFTGLLRLILSKHRREALRQIEIEITTQFERFADAGVLLDHIDGHQHVHMLPGVRRVVAALARDHALVMRVSHERWSAFPATLNAFTAGLPKAVVLRACSMIDSHPGPSSGPRVNYTGVFESGRLDEAALSRVLASLPAGVTEINVHPGYGLAAGEVVECSAADRKFLASAWRKIELEALSSPRIVSECESHGVITARISDLSPSQHDPGPHSLSYD
ncbi:MAG: carbohydrate deacetylase [Maioricimonas sp. JB049]